MKYTQYSADAFTDKPMYGNSAAVIITDAFADDELMQLIAQPKVYPNVTPDGTDDNWEPHFAIIGEIIDSKGSVE